MFRDEKAFLSNFTYVPTGIYHHGIRFNTVENAYQAAKCADTKDMYQFANIPPAQAKKLGRTVTLRPDWDAVKLDIMKDLLSQKFEYRKFANKLKATGDDPLIEENYWHDNYWGICKCHKCMASATHGQNHLGRLLTEIRNRLKNDVSVA